MDRQKIKIDLLLATITQILQKVVGYFVIVILTHYFSKDDMGAFFFAAAVAYLFSYVTELGLDKYIVRSVAEDDNNAQRVLGEALSIRFPAAIVAYLSLIGFIALTRPEMLEIVALTGLYVFASELYYVLGALLVGLRRIGLRSATQLIGQSLVVLLIWYTVYRGGDLTRVLIAYGAANVVLFLASLAIVRRVVGPFRLTFDPAVLLRVLKVSVPFYILMFLGLVVFKLDTLMLGFMLPKDQALLEVARYEAGYKFFEVSRLAVRPAAMIFFPVCTALAAAGDWEKFSSVFKKLMAVSFGLGLAALLIVAAVAGWVVPFVYGSGYEDSVVIVRVLYLTVPTLYVSFVGLFLANALYLERKAVWVMVAAIVFNVSLNAVLIPQYQALGAAWATVATESAIAFAIVYLIITRLRYKRANAAPAPPVSKETIERETRIAEDFVEEQVEM